LQNKSAANLENPKGKSMDLTKLSDKDLDALINNDLKSLSDEALSMLAEYKKTAEPVAQEAPSMGVIDALKRGAGMATRAVAPTATGMALGSMGGPMSTVAGATALPVADALNSLINLIASPFTDKRLPSATQSIQNLMTKAGVPGAPETQTPTERVLSTGLETMTNVAGTVPAFMARSAEAMPSVTSRVAQQMAVAPKTQAIVSPASVMAGQTVTEATGRPDIGLATTLLTGGVGSMKGQQREMSLPSEALGRVASGQYKAIEDAGIQIKTDEFVKSMSEVSAGLRKEGYTPKAYPKITGVVDELTSTATPKDWTELQALRKMIRGAQKSTDPEERRIASILMDDFDNYMMNVPQKDVAAGNLKQVAGLWRDARSTYSRMKKAEVFEDMMENATLDKSKFTQSGVENSLAKQLRDLSKNEKKMRLFTKDEQEAIKKAAKGGTIQGLLKFYGRFAPTGPVSGIFSGGLTVANPILGVPFALGAGGARMGATQMRKSSVEDLINMMRAGKAPEVIGGRTRAVAPTLSQGLLTSDQVNEEYKNLLGIQ
jgi:hypothetical protein